MRRLIAAGIFLVLLVGCSPEHPEKKQAGGEWGEPTKTGSPPAKGELATGREAFQKLFPTAHMWQPDAKPVRMRSEPTPEEFGRDGQTGLWRCWFASPGRSLQKQWVWSGGGANAPEQGVSPASGEDMWSARNASEQAWDVQYLKKDSSDAFAVAQKHGGENLTKSDSKLPVMYILDWDPRESKLIWHVIYGSSPTEYKLRIAVDATTGDYLRKEK